MAEPIDARGLMTDGGIGRYIIAAAGVVGIAIHHSVSGGSFFMSTNPAVDDELSQLLMIDQYHASLGWGGFGYHLAAFPSGRIYICGNLNGARAHVASRNNELVGLVLIGTFTDTPPPRAQLAAAAHGVAFMRRTYPARIINGHRNWALPEHATSCPGDTWASWLWELDSPPQEVDDMAQVPQGQWDQLYNWWFGPFEDPLGRPPGLAPPSRAAYYDWLLTSVDFNFFAWVSAQGHAADGKFIGNNWRGEVLGRLRDIDAALPG